MTKYTRLNAYQRHIREYMLSGVQKKKSPQDRMRMAVRVWNKKKQDKNTVSIMRPLRGMFYSAVALFVALCVHPPQTDPLMSFSDQHNVNGTCDATSLFPY